MNIKKSKTIVGTVYDPGADQFANVRAPGYIFNCQKVVFDEKRTRLQNEKLSF